MLRLKRKKSQIMGDHEVDQSFGELVLCAINLTLVMLCTSSHHL